MPQNAIKTFIDFFHGAALKIRNVKPQFERGKDGAQVKRALKRFSEEQLEMLAVWFLYKKPKLRPKIGTMLSNKIMEELERKIKDPDFWKDLDEIFEKHFKK